MHIEPVQIRGPRAALASVLQSALKFAEESDTGAEMKVRRQQVSLEKVSVAVRGSTTEVGVIQEFESLANLAADGGKPFRPAERDILQRIEPIDMH